jgi:hypothetical protein
VPKRKLKKNRSIAGSCDTEDIRIRRIMLNINKAIETMQTVIEEILRASSKTSRLLSEKSVSVK